MRKYGVYIFIFLAVGVTAWLLHLQGRLWLARSGEIKIWVGDAWGPDNSQHIFDPYSFSHIQHGFVFLGLLRLLFRRRFTLPVLLAIAVVLECGWELLENSAMVIDRYRETAAQGYSGDTVLNSVSDILCCSFGLWLAHRMGFRLTLIVFIVIEIVMLCWIKDSFLLNVLMLIYPFEGIKTWQTG